jgi:N-acyl homoserine lactone hydrolase
MSAAVHRLHMATFALAGRFNPPTYQDARMSVYAYLVVSAAGALLIDTGVGTGNDYIEARFEPHRTSLEDELGRLGLQISDVSMVVNSHLHFDHCGNNRRFADAEIFVQRAELAVAREMGKRYTVSDWFDYDGARLSPVQGDVQITAGITLFTADEFQRGGDPDLQAHAGLSDAYVRSIRRLRGIGADQVFFSHDNQ